MKPSLFCLAGAKEACFMNPKAGANGFLNTLPDLSLDSTLALYSTEVEILSHLVPELTSVGDSAKICATGGVAQVVRAYGSYP
jgi:hypothetical protein